MSIPLVDAGSPPKNLTPPGSAPNSGHPSPRGPASASPELKAKVEALLQKSLPPGDDKVLSQDLREIEAKHSLSELLVAVNENHDNQSSCQQKYCPLASLLVKPSLRDNEGSWVSSW